jgi:crooked neck
VWEELQGDLARARSVWERALDVNYRATALWLRYAEMEMKAKAINHARNVWDRAVSLLPRVDQLWYKYIHMEEALGCIGAARQLFERWMAWEPDHQGWAAYIKLELRHGETARARAIYERYTQCHPTVKAWLRYAKFEAGVAFERPRARAVYERAVTTLEGEPGIELLLVKFAQFEEFCKEFERSRTIYRYALDHLPKAAAQGVFSAYTAFEKQHGDRAGIEAVVLGTRRLAYEAAVSAEPSAYDAWFDYARLEEEAGDVPRAREVYERAVAAVPPVAEKRAWRRYIYLWIKYALFEELTAGDAARAREVYRAALRLVPHGAFSFSKLWVLAAQAEVRALDLGAARRLLGTALGLAPKPKLFAFYIDLELQLGAVERCRTLYQKFLEW